jgi:hypothetical protein
MKVKFGRVGIICVVLVLAFGVLGVGFAMWSDTLYIRGNVETGHINVEFVKASSSDPPGTNDTTLALDKAMGGFPYIKIQQQDKDVGTTTVVIDDPKSTTVTITNGYPCYTVWVELYTRNLGSIPVRLTNIQFDPPEVYVEGVGWIPTDLWLCSVMGLSTAGWIVTFTPSGGVEQVMSSGSNAWITNFPVELEHPLLLQDILITMLAELAEVQIHPGDTLDLHLLFHLTAEDVDFPGAIDIAPNLTGDDAICFKLIPVFTQWNE